MLDLFQQVCIAQAPAFSSHAIQAAADRVIPKGSDQETPSAKVTWTQDKSCTISASKDSPLTAPISFATSDSFVEQSLDRLGGGTIILRKSERNNSVFQYRMATGSGTFEIIFNTDNKHQNLNITKR